MSYLPVKVFSGSIASGASTLTSLDVSQSWRKIFVVVPTMSTAAEISVYGSSDNSTFYPVFERINTAPVQYQNLLITTGVASSGGIADLVSPLRYLQFRTSAVVSGGVAMQAICID